MKNTMFKEDLTQHIQNLGEVAHKLLEAIGRPSLEATVKASELEMVHSLFVLKILGDLKDNAMILEALNNMSEEEVTDILTEEGKKTLAEARAEMMFSMMMEVADKTRKMSESKEEG